MIRGIAEQTNLLALNAAIEAGELPVNSDVETLITSLSATFFTVPIIYNQSSLDEIKDAYQEQLSLFRCGAVNQYGSYSMAKYFAYS